MTAAEWIARLGLVPHPEGGFFRETYRSAERVAADCLPGRFAGDRALSTAIYYLLHGDAISALHRIKSDEVWHFHAGSALELVTISPRGVVSRARLGTAADASPQAVVAAGDWFGARVVDTGSYALVGCTVAPGFDFADFELADRATLLRQFPQHRADIEALTRTP